MTRWLPSVRLRTVTLAALFGFTSFFVQAAPTELPIPRPEALTPAPVSAAYCASEPTFSGYLSDGLATPSMDTRSTTGDVYGYLNNIGQAWSCTAFYRYDGVAWARTADGSLGNFDWGTLIDSITEACNWTVGSTDFIKANETNDCPDSDTEYAMPIHLADTSIATLLQGVYHNDHSPDEIGDFSFIHTDCDTYYGAADGNDDGERMQYNESFATTDVDNRPGSNCDPLVIDPTDTAQSLVVDATPPALAFDWPTAAGPSLVTSAFAGVQFDATDAVAGFSGTLNDWDLQRQKATWSGSACGTFASDPAGGSLESGTSSAANQVSSQGLLDNTCYRWTLAAKDANGNTATTITSGQIRTDLSGNLGQQPQHTFESWDLGAGDSLGVNVGTGNLVVSHPIVDLPIRGGSFSLGLTYNRHDTSSVGMGPGWRLDAFRRLVVNADSTVTFTDGDGSRHRFSAPTGSPTVSYTRPATLYATLTRDTLATPDRFTLTYRDRSVDTFDLVGSSAYLKTESDRFGNAMTFTHDASNQVTLIEDPAGRDIVLTWSAGKLVSVKDWAVVSAGVVQLSGTPNRTNRFFYDGAGNLAGWADPLNTTDSCPTGGNHVTCIAYPTAGLDIAKSQRIATMSAGVLGTASRVITTKASFDGLDVTTVKDAQEVSNATAGTAFSHAAPYQTQVVRRGSAGASPDTATRFTLLTAADPHARIATVGRKLGAAWITATTTYNAIHPIEVATVTEDAGGTLQRSTTTTYVASSMGLVARIDAPLDGTYRHHTDYTYNANNDVTQQIVSRQGDATLRTTTRSCYSATSCGTGDNDLRLFRTIGNYVDGTKGGTNGHVEDVTVEYLYDGYGQRIRATRSNHAAGGTLLDSRATGFEYDTSGNLTKEIDNYVSGTVTSPGDDITANGTTNARTDLTTVHTYDTAGNRVSTADPRRAIRIATGPAPAADDYITRWTYDSLDQRVTEKTPTTPGLAITCAVPSPNCRDSYWTYDELGAVRRTTDFGNLVTTTEFDRVGRATRTFEDPPDIGGIKPADTTSQTTYDPSGQVLTAKDQIQFDDSSRGYSAFVYDELGRQLASADAVTTAAATETDTTWDALDRQVSVTAGVVSAPSGGTAAAQTTITTYDLGDRAIKVDDEFTCTATTYDWRDIPTQTVEGLPSGSCSGTSLRTATHTNDALGRLTKTEVTAGAGYGDKPSQLTYDSVGRSLTSSSYVAATTTTSTLTSTHNLLDQVITESRTDGSLATTTYDPVGNQTDRCYWAAAPSPDEPCQPVGSSFTTAPTRHTSATFDARDNRVSLIDAATKATTEYDPDHNYLTKAIYVPTKMTGSSVDVEHQTTFSYDERHRLASMSHQRCTRAVPADPADHSCSSTSSTGSVAYEYDLNDNRTRVNENNGAASADRRYCFDPLDRLQYRNTSAACSSTVKDESYAYDDGGNRTQAVALSVTTDFAYNSNGQLCKVGATTCGTPNVTYDSAGLTATYNGWWFKYDADGRLVSACKSATCVATADKIAMVYDGEGRRTKIISTAANGSASTREFRYQGEAIVEERVNGAVSRSYLVDESGSVVQMVIPSGTTAGTYLVTYNGHGDAMALWRIKSDGALELANSFSYATWGQPTITTSHPNSANGNVAYGDLGFRFTYVGEFDVQWDNALGLGLYYMHARHYSPALGRFLQPDPDRTESNLYAYAANNPVTEIDPDGTCFIVCQLVVGAIIDSVVYLATTENASLGGLASAVAGGAVESAVNPFAKIGKIGKLVSAAGKVMSKFSKASRWTKKATRAKTRVATSCARHSFDGATLVTLADGGRVEIDGLQVGDEVLAWNEVTGETAAYPITAVWTHHDPITGWVVIDGEAIATTPEHPFYTVERGWVEASELQAGDRIPAATSGPGVVSSVTWLRGADEMYDLTVAVAHTFFVGDGGWLVHNCGGTGLTSRAARRQAMREQGIPTSQQPIRQYRTGQGRAYEYEVPRRGGGTRRAIVGHHVDARHGRHWEAGVAKPGGMSPRAPSRSRRPPHYYNRDPLTGRPKSRALY